MHESRNLTWGSRWLLNSVGLDPDTVEAFTFDWDGDTMEATLQVQLKSHTSTVDISVVPVVPPESEGKR